MRSKPLLSLSLLVVLLPTASLAASYSVDRLGWLAGVWTGTTGGVRMEEIGRAHV